MVEISYARVRDEGLVGSGANHLGQKMGAGLKFVCEKYRDAGSYLFGSGGVGGVIEAIADQWCPLVGVSPPTSEGRAPGGRCTCNLYQVSWTATNSASGATLGGTVDAVGPIGSIDWITEDNGTLAFGFHYGDASCGEGLPGFYTLGGGFSNDPTASAWSVNLTNIVPADGSPDACGSPIAKPVSKPIPPSSYSNPSYPVPYAPPGTNSSVALIPIILEPIVNVNPTLNVRVDGINFNFSLGGVNVSVNPSLDLDLNPSLPGSPSSPGLPGAQRPPRYPGDGAASCPDPCQPYDDGQLISRLDKIVKSTCPPAVSLSTVSSGVVNSATMAFGGRPRYVMLDIANQDRRVRTQDGGDSAQEVIFVGWYSWSQAGRAGERIPISHRNNCFYPPSPDCRVFTFCLTHQSTGQAVVTFEQPTDPPSLWSPNYKNWS